MDSTVIQEIANQLGVAVEQASQFVQDILPSYAGMKVAQTSTTLITLTVATAILGVVMVKGGKWCHRVLDDPENPWYDAGELLLVPGVIVISAFAILFVVWLCAMASMLPKLVGWALYPDAMLLQMVLDKVGA